MKLLLEQDVKGTGKKGEIVEYRMATPRNFLLPRKLAAPADAQAINAASIQKSAAAHRKFQAGLQARDLAKQLEGAAVTVRAKVAKTGISSARYRQGNAARAQGAEAGGD
jgi:large subunit ribosomal protein L9